MTSSLCGGTMCRSASMSTASRLWLVTTMSASRARARDASAKHSAPYGQRAAPDALAGRHRHLPPRRVVDARVELVAVAGLGLRRPSPQALDLLAEPAGLAQPLPVPRGRRRVVEEACRSGSSSAALLQLGQAQVVVASLEHGEGGPAAEHRLDRVGEPGQVVVDELGLQRQGRGRDHHRAVDQQRRRQVGQRLAGAGAGLHQQVLAVRRRPPRSRRPSAAGPGGPSRREPRRPRRRATPRRTAGARLTRSPCDGTRTPRRTRPRHVPLTHRRESGYPNRLGCLHAERDRPGGLPQVRRIRPPGLSRSPARRGRPGRLARRDPRHRVRLPRPAVGRADPVRPADAARRLVDRHVQPAAADQRGLLRHHHAGPLGGRHRAPRRPRPGRGPAPRRPARSSCATRTSSPSTGPASATRTTWSPTPRPRRSCSSRRWATAPSRSPPRTANGWRWSSRRQRGGQPARRVHPRHAGQLLRVELVEDGR